MAQGIAVSSLGGGAHSGPDVILTTPCLLTGGTEVQTHALGRALVHAGQKVRLVCYHEAEAGTAEAFSNSGIPTDRLGLPRRMGLLRVAARLREYLVRWRPRAVHVQYMAPGAVVVLAATLARVPRILATVHQPWRPELGLHARALLKGSALLCSSVTAVSNSTLRSWFGPYCVPPPWRSVVSGAPSGPMSSAGGVPWRHCRVLYNTVDTEAIADLCRVPGRGKVRRRWGLSDGPVVGMFGRIGEAKGVDVMRAAFKALRRVIPAARLVLAGPSLRAAPIARPKRNAAEPVDGVQWVGPLSWRDTIRLIGAVDVVAVPSRYEGFGLVAAEALAAGVAVVASRTGGLQEVVQDGRTGILVPVGDAGALAEALMRLLENDGLRTSMAKAGRADVAQRFGVPQYESAVRELYGL